MDDTKMSDYIVCLLVSLGPLSGCPPVISLSHYSVVITSHGTRLSTTHKQHAHKTRRSNPQHDWPCQKRFTTKEIMISTHHNNTKNHVKHQGTKMEGQVL